LNILADMTPEKLKKLSPKELHDLCGEIRARLIDTVIENGGHLASNLGVVELTVALHRAFDSPRDKIVWDVGHQSYVHKLLTGREPWFDTIRKSGGLSGFPKREESIHDAFGAGHSSTSISAALGMAHARDLSGEDYCVVAVIGDGALTGGMAYEALNDAGRHKRPLIVVLNDNGMSIAKNVGALQASLTRLRTRKGYLVLKRNISRRWPRLKAWLVRRRARLKHLLLPPTSTFFEELGFKYLGPINGHDVSELERVFERAKRIEGPVLIHVATTKGKGYSLAEQNPEGFHGIAPFFMESARSVKPEKTNSAIFGEALCALAERDERIVAVTAAMPAGTGLSEFAKRFPNRFFDVGIAEQHAVILCAGMAANGLRPVFAVYSSFFQRAFDQLVHDVCMQKLPVVFAVDRSGPVGEDGPTHHGAYDIGYLTLAPDLVVCSPATQKELSEMLKLAFRLERPVAIRYGRGALPAGEECSVTFGKWQLLRPLQELTVVATGRMADTAMKAVDELSRQGIVCGLLNARFLKPMDGEAVEALHSCKAVVTVEDGVKEGGLGEHLAAALPGVPVTALTLPDSPLPSGTMEELLKLAGLDEQGIAHGIESIARKSL
jgi:1-deoxy-D-xylulose-5-phosphate synthase